MASALIGGLLRYHAERELRQPRPAEIHIAILVQDMKTARHVKRTAAVVTPKRWQGTAVLHVLVGNRSGLSDEMRVFLASLRLFNPQDLDMVYHTELEIGWQQDTMPLNVLAPTSSTSDD